MPIGDAVLRRRLRRLRFDRDELSRRSREIEAIGGRRGRAFVSRGELPEPEDVFGKAQYARGFVPHVRNVPVLGVGRDYEQRNAKAEAIVVFEWRRDFVIEAAPIVPLNEDGRAVPKFAFADRVHQRRNPRGAGLGAAARVIGVCRSRRRSGIGSTAG